jgi:hypothetical protein
VFRQPDGSEPAPAPSAALGAAFGLGLLLVAGIGAALWAAIRTPVAGPTPNRRLLVQASSALALIPAVAFLAFPILATIGRWTFILLLMLWIPLLAAVIGPCVVVGTLLRRRAFTSAAAYAAVTVLVGVLLFRVDMTHAYLRTQLWLHRDALAAEVAACRDAGPGTANLPWDVRFLSYDGTRSCERGGALSMSTSQDWRAESGTGLVWLPRPPAPDDLFSVAPGGGGSPRVDLGGGWWWMW